MEQVVPLCQKKLHDEVVFVFKTQFSILENASSAGEKWSEKNTCYRAAAGCKTAKTSEKQHCRLASNNCFPPEHENTMV